MLLIDKRSISQNRLISGRCDWEDALEKKWQSGCLGSDIGAEEPRPDP